jgi:predicted secreted protein
MEEIVLAKNECSTVTLKGLGSAGYRWSFTVDNPRALLVERLIVSPKPGEVSAASGSLDEQFVMTGEEAGQAVVRFAQSRPFEQSKPPIATREILVRVHEN